MVCGSDDNPKVSGKPDYDGSLKQWRSVKISLRSYLHVKQKLQVVQHGVSNKATANKETHTTSQLSNFETPATRLAPLITSSIKAHKASIQWYIYVQDTSIFIGDTDLQPSAGRALGPYTATQVKDMIENGSIDANEASFYRESGLPRTLKTWKPFSALARELFRDTTEMGDDDDSRRGDLPKDIEGRTENDDVDAYHLILGCINIKGDTGSALVQQIDEKFGEAQSGHELFAWLDARSKASIDSKDEGLMNANDARDEVDKFKLPEGELTKEVLIVQGGAFKTLYHKQPEKRWGLPSDCFDAWMEKLPDEPFEDLLDRVKSTNQLLAGENVLDDFDKANKMLCSAYSHWCRKNSLVQIKHETVGEMEKRGEMVQPRAALLSQGPNSRNDKTGDDAWKTCFRCWKQGDHLTYECTKPAKMCVTCGLDASKTRVSCGGEYEPLCCMVKGYVPKCRVPVSFMDKLRYAAIKNNVKFHDDTRDDKAHGNSTALITTGAGGSTPGGLDTDGMTYKVEFGNDGRSYLVGRKGL